MRPRPSGSSPVSPASASAPVPSRSRNARARAGRRSHESSPATCRGSLGRGRAAARHRGPLRVAATRRNQATSRAVRRPRRRAARTRRRTRRGPVGRAAASRPSTPPSEMPTTLAAADAAGVEVGDEVVHVELDVERARIGEAAAPAPRRSSECTVRSPRAARSAASFASCCGGAQRPVEQQHVARPRPVDPPADRVATRSRELAGCVARDERPDGVPPQLAGRASAAGRRAASSAAGTLNPARLGAGMRGQRGVAGVRRARPEHDRGDRHVPPGVVRTPDDGGLGHRRVPLEHGLDLRRGRCSRRRARSGPSGGRRRRDGRPRRAGRGRRSARVRRRRPAARRGTRSSATVRQRRSRPRRPAPDRRCARSSRGAAGPPSRARAPPPRTAAP